MNVPFHPMARPDLESLAPFDSEFSERDHPDALSVPWSRSSVSRPARRNRWSARRISLATILVMLGAWALTAWLGVVSPVFLPSPAAVAAKFVSVATEGFVDSTLPRNPTGPARHRDVRRRVGNGHRAPDEMPC